ncbi:MAG TPA: MOSC domain-containing protein [Bryobacteraceae bacterium]|nr:MOSC domain-containing protein [Bryobacteraceae bacterium]
MLRFATMQVLSVNVGVPAPLSASGTRQVLSAIVKTPVSGPVRVGRLNLDGDKQADLRVHGGRDKAVYLYPSEHYEFWRRELSETQLSWGMFGENLSTEGVLETTTCIGDRFRIGSALLEVRQPRMPCFKLALRFGRRDMVKRFWTSGRSGIYFAVVEEGTVAAGDSIVPVSGLPNGITVDEILRLYRDPLPAHDRVEVALASPLAGSWKRELRERLTVQ